MAKRPRVENTSRILRKLWMAKTISRVQISRDLGLNKSTISDITTRLIEQGVVFEKEEGESTPQGGRKPVLLELNKNYGYIIGLEIRLDNYTLVAMDLSGEILFSKTEEDNLLHRNFEDRVIEILKKFPTELNWIGAPILGAGVGLSGIIDSKNGVIKGSIALKISESLDFKEKIGSQLDFPVFVENDANCCAWGELAFHRDRGLNNFLFTLVEFHPSEKKEIYENISVGLGIVIRGQVYSGDSNSAGEFHSIFCTPGELGQFKVSSEKMELKENSNELKEFISELSKHIALFTNTFNFGQVFLGGDIENYQDMTRPALSKAINENWMYTSRVNCEIKFSSLANKSVAYGAGGMVLERLFETPEQILNM